MKVILIHHHDPRSSFRSNLVLRAQAALNAQGHQVEHVFWPGSLDPSIRARQLLAYSFSNFESQCDALVCFGAVGLALKHPKKVCMLEPFDLELLDMSQIQLNGKFYFVGRDDQLKMVDGHEKFVILDQDTARLRVEALL